MRPVRMMACALLLSAVAAAAQDAAAPTAATAPAPDLSGLWQAKRRFGPDAQGRLILARSDGGYVADVAGRVVPVRLERDELAFDLPGDRGGFRGRFEGRALIRGHWLRPGTPANMSRYASPVVLSADGAGRWSGTVEAMQDELTFFLLLRPQADGTMRAVLRNPDRDIGTQWGADRLVRNGNQVTLMGHRRGQPERALGTGAYDPETDRFTLDFPNRGGAFVFGRDGDDSDFYPRGRIPGRYAYRAPPPLRDGWPTGTLDEARIDRGAIERLVQSILETPMDSTDAPQIHALLIARHGRLVLEEYFHGYGRDRLHDTRSAAKSISAITIGAAMRAGAPLSLASPVYQVMNGGSFPADLEPQKRAMTLEHLLTMSSGFFCDDGNDAAPGNEERMTNQEEEPDYYRYTLAVPQATPPGENSVYCSASPNLALGMLGAATRETPLRAFDRLVAGPMQIRRYAWVLDPLGRPYGGGSVQVLPRDFLKLGQLMLNGGSWQGRRILDPAFAAAATSPRYHLANVFYGYLWWIEDFPYKDRIVRSFSARGAGGNLVTVVPALDLVIATMAGNYFSRTQIDYTNPLIPRSILPAVRERGDDPQAPVRDREFTSPYGRATDGSRVQ
ncbi:MAG TPA: serine hydrolase domain-containing protein [Allosphingosinicella sp.]|nr:serine hydrolase domain-containing protein [Allosphingosinicella sp.]